MVIRKQPKGDSTLPIIGHLKKYPQRVLIRMMLMAHDRGIWDEEKGMVYIMDGIRAVSTSLRQNGENISRKQVEHAFNKLEDEGLIIRVLPPEYKGKWPVRYRTYLPMMRRKKTYETTEK